MNIVSLSEALARNSLDRAVNPAAVRQLALDFFNTTIEDVFPDEVQNGPTRKEFLEIFDTDDKAISMIDALKNCRQKAMETGKLDDLFLMAVLCYIPQKKHHRLFDHNLYDYLELSGNAAAYKPWFQYDYLLYREKYGHFPNVYNVLGNMCIQVSENGIDPEGLNCCFFCEPLTGVITSNGIERPFFRSGNDPCKTLLMANRVYILMTQIPYDLYFRTPPIFDGGNPSDVRYHMIKQKEGKLHESKKTG